MSGVWYYTDAASYLNTTIDAVRIMQHRQNKGELKNALPPIAGKIGRRPYWIPARFKEYYEQSDKPVRSGRPRKTQYKITSV